MRYSYVVVIILCRAQLLLSESSKDCLRPGTSGLSSHGGRTVAPLSSSSTSNIPVEMETDQVLKVAKQNIGRLQSKKVQYLTPSMLCDISLCYVTFLEITTEATPTIFKNEKERILCFS